MGTIGGGVVTSRLSYWFYGFAGSVGDECCRKHEEEHGECNGFYYVLCWADSWYVLTFISLPIRFEVSELIPSGPQCFKSSEAPSYHSGIVAMLVGFILNLVFNLTLRFLYGRENARRDAALEGKSEEEIEILREESRKQGFENITDKQNVSVLHQFSK